MPANGYEFSFWGDKDVPQLETTLVVQWLRHYTCSTKGQQFDSWLEKWDHTYCVV